MNTQEKVEYRGFSIEPEDDKLAVRYYDETGTMHDFKPWANTQKEAKGIVDKIIAHCDEEGNFWGKK